MENNPKKSKAFIITFIAVLALLFLAYFLFKNSDQIFGTKNSTSISKMFAPLLGTSKSKDLATLNTTQSNNPNGNTVTSATNTTVNTQTGGDTNTSGGFTNGTGFTNGNFGTNGGFGAPTGGFENITPPVNPLPTPADNGGGTTGGGTGNGNPGPTPNPTPTPTESYCPVDDPLEFTDAERAELEKLTTEYYLVAPTLKTIDDVEAIKYDNTNNQALVDKATDLTSQCQSEKADASYTGPQTIKDNPYYNSPTNNGATPYVPTFEQFEQLFKIW